MNSISFNNKLKVLTWEELGTAFAQHESIRALPNIEVHYAEKLTQKNIQWADCFAGYPPAQSFNLSSLKWIHHFGAGVNRWLERTDIQQAKLTRTVGDMGQKMAEFCLAYILPDIQEIDQIQNNQKKLAWKQNFPLLLKTQTVAILGIGSMGGRIAEVMHFFGMNVIGVNRSGKSDQNIYAQLHALEDFLNSPPHFDILINALPLTTATTQILNSTFFQKTKNIHFINVGRGATVNDKDLIEGIENENIRKATLDVFIEEPLPQHSPFWTHPKVMVSPHQSALTSVEDAISSFLICLNAFHKGEKPHLQVDFRREY